MLTNDDLETMEYALADYTNNAFPELHTKIKAIIKTLERDPKLQFAMIRFEPQEHGSLDGPGEDK